MSETTEPPDVYSLLKQWEEESQQPQYDPVNLLTTLCEIVEAETEVYMKMDPDPFDERHPSRAYPSCSLGHTLKVLFRKEAFMTKLVNDYVRDTYYSRQGMNGKDARVLNIVACRLMLDIIPGLETAVVFEMPTNDLLVQKLFSLAEKSVEPLQTYATGLLASAMEVQEIAVIFREQNLKLVPLMLERLHSLQAEALAERNVHNNSRPFALFGKSENEIQNCKKDKSFQKQKSPFKSDENEMMTNEVMMKTPQRLNGSIRRESDSEVGQESRRSSIEGVMSPPPKPSPYGASDCSNSSWAEMETYVIGNVQMHPPTLATKQIFILKYLSPMGEYQEFLSHVFEKNALELIFQLINLRETKNARLSFEALKYLAALLCHKKCSIEFINMNGLQKLLEVPRPSIAATGVSICLYYLAYCEDAMERVCLFPSRVVSNLVRYSLWLLECSHDSGRCHATMFFGLSFQFRVILEEFDAQDGLRKLYNVISTLPILSVEEVTVTEDEENSARQMVRHVCVALKRYFEAHLYIRAEQVRRAHFRDTTEYTKFQSVLPSYKSCKSSQEELREQINTLLEFMSFRAQWAPVDNLLQLGGITLLLQIIAFAYEWNYSGRGETVRSALDVLCICSTMPRVQLQLCEKVELPDDTNTVGINVILGAAEGEIVADPDVQRAALHALITCVCAPIYRVGGTVGRFSSGGKKRAQSLRSSEEVIKTIWDALRTTNGIMVLLNLITVKMPITDADSIRGLACEALAGLARSETVRQIISKLPLFTTGQLQSLMRDPILQDRRQEHVTFQKFALELLERVSGNSNKSNGKELEASLTNIHRANIIAQTRIQFNDRELLQLIQQHLTTHGLTESASALQKEAGLPPVKTATHPPLFLSPFTYQQRLSSTPSRARPGGSGQTRPSMEAQQSQSPASSSVKSLTLNGSPLAPIKLSLSQCGSRRESRPAASGVIRSLEKQISSERGVPRPSQPKEINITLDSIITEYLMNQHALCKNPMATCPQFTLFEPHKCPDPKMKNEIPMNFAVRLSRGIKSRRLDQKLIHSRFFPVHTFRYGEDNAFFTCCDFTGQDRYIVIGTQHGEVKLFNLHSGLEVASNPCHESYITHLQCSRNSLLLTSSTWRKPLSSCWSLKDNRFQVMFPLDEEEYVEFGKLGGDRVIGTRSETASIYDTGTGKLISTLKPTMSNQYNKNRATFSPTDDLVLSDGVLWDVNAGKEIHKLDKLNQTVSGVFHPNGLEVVSNTEVWDLRTFHLLRTVPALDQCEVLFSPASSVIYSVTMERESEDEAAFETSFKTLDSHDYSSIATIDVKKSIYDLACNKRDTQIAIVENQGVFDSIQESIVKIYDIGRSRSNGDEPDEDDDDDEMDPSDGSGSDDDQHNDSLPLELDAGSDNSLHSDDDNQENESSDGSEMDLDLTLTSGSSDSSDEEFYL